MTRRQRVELAVLLGVGILPFLLNGFYNPLLAATPEWFWTVEVITWIAMPATILVVARRRNLITLRDLGLSAEIRGTPHPGLVLILAIVVTVALYLLDRAGIRLASELWPTNPGAIKFDYGQMLPPPGPRTGWLRMLALVHYSITAGVVEEIYYRGMMMRLFPGGYAGAIGFTLASSLIFASVHFEGGLIRLLETLTWGIASAAIYRATRNLWPLIVAHVVVDYLWLVQF